MDENKIEEIKKIFERFEADLIDMILAYDGDLGNTGLSTCQATPLFLESLSYVGGVLSGSHDVEHVNALNKPNEPSKISTLTFPEFESMLNVSLERVAVGAVTGYYDTFVRLGATQLEGKVKEKLQAVDHRDSLKTVLKEFEKKYGKPENDGGLH